MRPGREMTVLFYISGHGFGHATRMVAVMKALRQLEPRMELLVRTGVPEWLFRGETQDDLFVFPAQVDAGVVEKDLFSQDSLATLEATAAFFSEGQQLVADEARFALERKADVIVSDIPPLASVIGHEISVPVVAIGNFSWDFIYRPYARQHPEYSYLISAIEEAYEKTTLMLRLPLGHEMRAFPNVQDIPFIAREPSSSADETRRALGLADCGCPIILVAVRQGFDVSKAVRRLAEDAGCKVLVFGDIGEPRHSDVLRLDKRWQPRFLDVLAASDAIVSKLGYGIVADCLAAHTPLIFPPRLDWAEHDLLVEGLPGVLPALNMPMEEFRNGEWATQLARFLSGPMIWGDVDTGGAMIAAEIIRAYA